MTPTDGNPIAEVMAYILTALRQQKAAKHAGDMERVAMLCQAVMPALVALTEYGWPTGFEPWHQIEDEAPRVEAEPEPEEEMWEGLTTRKFESDPRHDPNPMRHYSGIMGQTHQVMESST
jgi:hypothetical protein